MRKIVALSICCAFLLSLCVQVTGARAAEALKIAYVDVATVFDSYNKTKEKEATLTGKGDAKKAERDKLVDKIRNMKNEIELLSESQKEKKQQAIDENIRRLQDFDRETKIALRRERDDMVRGILEEIDAVIADYAKKNKYTYILNSRVLVYAQDQDDLTAEILEILNSKSKK